MKGAPSKLAIPQVFLRWLASSRLDFLNGMLEGRPLRYFSAHLPVMATWNGSGEFPVNLTVKGIGLVPRDDLVGEYIDLFESLSAEARAGNWGETLSKRVDALRALYGNVENFNPFLLGGLEIFEGTAFRNLLANPRASLLYVGMARQEGGGIRYISFQVNGHVEVLKKDSLYYRYLLAARRLFEFDKFHIYQPEYPYGYLLHVQEVKDKTPWSRAPGHPSRGL